MPDEPDPKPLPDPIAEPLPANESRLFGVSIRAYTMLMVVGTICAREIALFVHCLMTGSYVEPVKEPLYTLVVGIVAYYFGQQTRK